MPDILQISCVYNNEITSHYLSAEIRHNQSYYFTNEYTSIPNEYGLAPAYFPKVFFSEIVGYLNVLLSDNSEDEDPEPFYPWLFNITYRNGAHKHFGFSTEEVEKKAEKIMRLFHYNEFLDDYHNKLDDKKFLATDSSLITLQNVRGQISNRYVLLNQFFEQRSTAFGKADFNSANYTLSYDQEGSMAFTLKKDATEKLTVKIDADGNFIPWAEDELTAEYTGEGTLLAFGSARPTTEENYSSGTITAYKGRALAVIRAAKGKGQSRLTVKSKHFGESEMNLQLGNN